MTRDTTKPSLIQAEENRRLPDWSSSYDRYYSEYKRANPKASREELNWYAEGCVQGDINGYSSVAG